MVGERSSAQWGVGGPRSAPPRLAAASLVVVLLALVVGAGPVGAGSGGADPAAPAPAGASTDGGLEPGTEVRVAIRELPPFVELDHDPPTGFTVELWEEVAERLDVTTEWVVVGSVEEQLAAVVDGRADVAGTAISVTAEREELVDFSYPYFDSGLQVLVSAEGQVGALGALGNLWDRTILGLLATFAIAIVVVGVIVWLLERGHNPEFQGQGPLHGAGHGIWWAVVTVSTVGYGDRVTRRAASRLIAALWIVFGLVFVAQFTATITANLTVDELASDIRGPDDLPGRQVATVAGTTAAAWLAEEGIPAREVGDADEMVDLVVDGAVDAAVFDAPVLLAEVERVGEDRATVVGAPFTFETYAFAVPEGSGATDRLDRALLDVIEDGTYQRIRRGWFPQGQG